MSILLCKEAAKHRRKEVTRIEYNQHDGIQVELMFEWLIHIDRTRARALLGRELQFNSHTLSF
jgi:hypothetical protein